MSKRYFTYAEAAEELRIKESWLRRHIKKLPRVQIDRQVFFTQADLDEITEMHHHRPQTAGRLQSVPAGAASRPAGPTPLPARARRTS